MELANTRKLEWFCQYDAGVASKESFGSFALEGKLVKNCVLVDEVKRTITILPARTQPAHFL